MNKQQSGFTLIELVVVIVILGLLAATALPRFINISTDAREASVQGVAGGLRAAAALARAAYIVDGTNPANVTMDNTSVAVLDEATYAGRGGRPSCAGIFAALPTPDGWTTVPANAGACANANDTVTYTPPGGGATCQVQYDPDANADPVVVDTSDCA